MEAECAIIGGGPAGLSAALVLGRARRSVLLFDNHKPRNAVTRQTHGFLTRDGVMPQELRWQARRDIAAYPSVFPIDRKVESVGRHGSGGFVLHDANGSVYHVRKLLLATGLRESLPHVPGVADFYGKSLFNCPYCDGWELRDQPLIVIADGDHAFSLVRLAYQWSRDLILCTNGSLRALEKRELQAMENRGIVVAQQRITGLVGENGMLDYVVFEDGTVVRRKGGFVSPYWNQATPFAGQLGCMTNGQGGTETDRMGRTSVRGVYAAGDTVVIAPAQTAIAAGEGSRAAIGMNSDLIKEDFPG